MMNALETIVSIADHRLVVENAVLPARVDRARVIVLWDTLPSNGRRLPPPALAGLGQEKGDILSSSPESDWEVLD